MRVLGRDEVANFSVIPVQRRSAVVPMDGHRESVGDEGAPEHASQSVEAIGAARGFGLKSLGVHGGEASAIRSRGNRMPALEDALAEA